MCLAIYCPSGIFLRWTVNTGFFRQYNGPWKSLFMRTEELNKQKWARERGSEKKSGKKIVPGSGPFLDPKGSDA